MFLQFIGVNEKIVNVNAIFLIEDASTENEGSIAKVITIAGEEFEFTGTDADAIFERADLMIKATNHAITQLTTPQTANA